MGEKTFEENGKFYTIRGGYIYLIGGRDEFGKPRRLRKPKKVARAKKRQSGFGSTDPWSSGNSWSDDSWGGGGVFGSSGGLWDDEDTKLAADDDMFSSGGSSSNQGGLWDDVKNDEDFFGDTKKSEEQTKTIDNKTYHSYKFNKDITRPDTVELNKPAHPWAIKSKDNEEHIVVFQTEEVYTLKEDINYTIISAILGETNIAPKEIPEEFNKFLYGLLNVYLVNVTFTSIQNFIVDYNTLKNMEIEEEDKRALEKVQTILKSMLTKKNYQAGDKLKIALEKRILLSNKEQITVEIESFDTLDWVEIPNDSYLHDMMKEFGPLHYLKVDNKTYVIKDNKIRILHIEE